MLQLSGLGFRYRRGIDALSEVDAALGPGTVAVLGPNGAGKSTLMSILATIRRPSAGTFAVDGVSVLGAASVRAHRASLGVVPQELSIFPGYTVTQFLSYVAWLRKIPAADTPAAMAQALAAVDLSERATARVATLSGGMRQRLALAQGLLNRPRLLLLDEPTVGLDPQQRALFLTHLNAVATATQVLVATHLVEDVAATARQVLVLAEGRVRFNGSIEAFCALSGNPGVSAEAVSAAYLALLSSPPVATTGVDR